MIDVPDFLTPESPEVYYSTRAIGRADSALIEFLKVQAQASSKQRCRVCFHPSPEASQQEMMIAMHRDSYVPPHKHKGKGETLLVIEGDATAPIFDEDGTLSDAIRLGPPESGHTFFYRMPDDIYHGLWINTEWLIYIETTVGPFRRDATVFPQWGIDANDHDAIGDARATQLAQIDTLANRRKH